MFKKTLLVSLVAACLVHQGEALFGQDGFTKLNNYLAESEESSDLNKNVDLVLKLLSDEGGSTSSSLKKAAVLFASLPETEGSCDRTSYEALRKNVEATGNVANVIHNPLRRIDNLVHQYAMKQAAECPEVYQEVCKAKLEFLNPITTDKEKMKSMNPMTLENVQTLSRRFKSTLIFLMNLRKVTNMKQRFLRTEDDIFNSKSLDDYIDRELELFASDTLDVIKKSAKEDPDVVYTKLQVDQKKGKRSVNSEKLKRLYDDYVLRPCQSYIDTTEADVFEPATFDYKFSEKPYREENLHYLKSSWIDFRICKQVLRVSKSLLKEMERAMR